MIGVDEVGRGAWAGPLLVCAVRLHKNVEGLTDSKVLSAKRRDELALQIQQHADIGYGWVSAKELDELGLARSLRVATNRAITDIKPLKNEKIIIDGTVNFAPSYNVTTMVKADMSVPCVSAASIVAKVARDDYMHTLDKKYPAYGFITHVGYGTQKHQSALSNHGACPEHRRSFNIYK